MDEGRRNFFKVAGASAMGIAWGVPVVSALAKAIKSEPLPGGMVGKRWALMIDINKCRNPEVARACSDACRRLHNIPDIERPHSEIEWIWSDGFENAFPNQVSEHTRADLRESKVLVMCNHCDRPPCVRVCPTQATFRRADGIVMMDEHRCIGCRYCIAACPYGARSFNWEDPAPHIKHINPDYPHRTRGVVEKCTLCAERLAEGLPPACVEAANRVAGPGAMIFGDLGNPNSDISQALKVKTTIRRKPSLGTSPSVFYVV